MSLPEPIRILAIDVGAGTQDILVYESGRSIENCVKLILPSQTQVVARRIREATRRGSSIYLSGNLMGGGASTDAIDAHLAAGLEVYAGRDAARTIHNDLTESGQRGVSLVTSPPPGAEIIWFGDVDLNAIAIALERFGVPMPSLYAIAVQDHGYAPDLGNLEFRYEFLQRLLAQGGDLRDMIFRELPELHDSHESRPARRSPARS